MPLEVIMPALGMAQDSGLLVSWQKQPGDRVDEGDVLFEVETDKSTMEVEAQGAGYLTQVTAKAGDDVPVGQVIACISDSPDADTAPAEGAPEPEPSEDAGEVALPEGHQVVMPTLGMAQDSGVLVSWKIEPGGEVGVEDILFEVETDKSTVEVQAGASGFLAAILAQPGEDVPTGQPIAIISAAKPDTPVQRSAAAGAPKAQVASPAGKKTEAPASVPKPAKSSTPAPAPGDRILASPKARRLAMEAGLDLERLAKAGFPQPYHVRDLETLRSLPVEGTGAASPETGRRLEADLPAEGFTAFAEWAAVEAGRDDVMGLLAGLAAASLRHATGSDGAMAVAVERFGTETLYLAASGPTLNGQPAGDDASPTLRLRDLRGTRITALALGPEEVPVLTLMTQGAGLRLVLECGPGQLSAPEALALLSEFAGRIEDPLRHLL